ncbi:acyltransferase [Clostridium botulinum]|uniref:acyltransferase n=1 Tax=Clostridium botulinum TaxID=1491 RepID=UPI00016BB208|nr:acyltransferase [Clostridium botulinum]APC84545.1 hexapeptide repeat of succinyl-transferase family protein [Clostridium botulinum]AXG97185.1 N-acetyltransferase [Clostridium botulinum]EDT81815.1 putative acetyltransferase [Clostridium botulinum NCTC 2916]MBY6773012.1 N-acetyltransferase [Clostridium botulinum]MBY6776629.1 N-acetyltransferase [Clostridium botulinum]
MKMNYISPKSKLGNNVEVGRFAVIEDDVVIGENCIIGHNVIIHKGTIIGNNVRIDDNTVIGKEPMRSVNSIFKNDKKLEPCKINDECLIGAGAIVYIGSKIGNKALVADLAVIREDVTIGERTIIGKGATIENFCKVGSNCKIQTNVYLTAYSEVENYVFIAPCVVTSNDNYAARSKERFGKFKGVTIKKGGRIGAGAVILPGKIIHEDGFAAAGSLVTRDVEKAKIVAGVPAKIFNDVPEEQLLENQ